MEWLVNAEFGKVQTNNDRKSQNHEIERKNGSAGLIWAHSIAATYFWCGHTLRYRLIMFCIIVVVITMRMHRVQTANIVGTETENASSGSQFNAPTDIGRDVYGTRFQRQHTLWLPMNMPDTSYLSQLNVVTCLAQCICSVRPAPLMHSNECTVAAVSIRHTCRVLLMTLQFFSSFFILVAPKRCRVATQIVAHRFDHSRHQSQWVLVFGAYLFYFEALASVCGVYAATNNNK